MNISQHSNTSINNTTGGTTSRTVLIIVESCIFVLLNITALVGNSLVCLAFYRKPSLRTVTNYFVLSLAITDLSMAVLVMPLSVISTIANIWVTGEFSCKLNHYLVNILSGASLLTIALITINRYYCVVKADRYLKAFSKERSTVMAVSAWVVTTTLVPLFFLAIGARFPIFNTRPRCRPAFPDNQATLVYSAISSLFIAFPSITILVCYIKIYWTIHHHNAATAPSSQMQGAQSAFGAAEAKITKMLTVVVVGFYICWLPLFVTNICQRFSLYTEALLDYYHFYNTFFLFGSSAMNPMIFVTMSRAFRKEFLKIMWQHFSSFNPFNHKARHMMCC